MPDGVDGGQGFHEGVNGLKSLGTSELVRHGHHLFYTTLIHDPFLH